MMNWKNLHFDGWRKRARGFEKKTSIGGRFKGILGKYENEEEMAKNCEFHKLMAYDTDVHFLIIFSLLWFFKCATHDVFDHLPNSWKKHNKYVFFGTVMVGSVFDIHLLEMW